MAASTPTCLSVAIAVDRATRENGCLQVIRGSHRLGRLDHGRVGGQTGADIERVAQVMRSHERVYVEMAPGDALFFHCNTLHCLGAEPVATARATSCSAATTRRRNDPYKEHHHPRYTPLAKLPDSAIKEIGLTLAGEARAFFDPEKDKTVEARPARG